MMGNTDIIIDKEAFDIKATLECGQLFRFTDNITNYHLRSLDKECILFYRGDSTIIETNDSTYFYQYFDISRDYSVIKSSLIELPYMRESISHGSGLRIVNQDPFEAIISFIISANNNIPRIKKIIECISGGGAFPTINELADFSVTDFINLKTGYRADYLKCTVEFIMANQQEFSSWGLLDTDGLLRKLMQLKGVGAKVADCIALFGYHHCDVFPVDTWIMQVYRAKFGDISDSKAMRKQLITTYGDLSGYAQQYLFYSARDGKLLR